MGTGTAAGGPVGNGAGVGVTTGAGAAAGVGVGVGVGEGVAAAGVLDGGDWTNDAALTNVPGAAIDCDLR